MPPDTAETHTAIRELHTRLARLAGEPDGISVLPDVLHEWFARFDLPLTLPALGPAADQTTPLAPQDLSQLREIGLRTVVRLASRQFPSPGVKERVIRDQTGISPTRYYQLLNALLDSPEAAAADPCTVNRLRRRRDRMRAAREKGTEPPPDPRDDERSLPLPPGPHRPPHAPDHGGDHPRR